MTERSDTLTLGTSNFTLHTFSIDYGVHDAMKNQTIRKSKGEKP
jgi:hypothetical protein